MQEMIAYCGIICTECPTYQATQKNDNQGRVKIAEEWSKRYKHAFKTEDINCDGCLAESKRQIGYCMVCDIRKCGSDKKLVNCAHYFEYPCEKVNNVLSAAPQAKAKLDAVRNSKIK
jgi:hypothetical protein